MKWNHDIVQMMGFQMVAKVTAIFSDNAFCPEYRDD